LAGLEMLLFALGQMPRLRSSHVQAKARIAWCDEQGYRKLRRAEQGTDSYFSAIGM